MKDQKIQSEFHGYVGNAIMLNSGKVGRICAGNGLKLYVRMVDGSIEECYHNDIRHVFVERYDVQV